MKSYSYENPTPDFLVSALKIAHKSKPRKEIVGVENNFYVKYIKGKKVLVVGSGLGHEAVMLSKNNKVVGIDIFDNLIDISKENKDCIFKKQDIFTYKPKEKYDVAILNMGTMGNFENWRLLIDHVLTNVADVFYFSFYLSNKSALNKRKLMYLNEVLEDSFIQDGLCFISKDYGIQSCSLPEHGIESLRGFVKIYYLHDMLGMAKFKDTKK